MRIADDKPTDKKRFADVYGYKFDKLRRETMDWFKTQELILMPFNSGGNQLRLRFHARMPEAVRVLRICAGTSAGLCKRRGDRGLQAACDHLCCTSVPSHPLRRQSGLLFTTVWMTATRYSPITCIRARLPRRVFYSVLLDIGEQEGWTTCHTSAGRLITPYENELVIMHEGASGGGKSEMLQDIAREPDGEVLLSTNTVTGEKTYLHISSTCKIEPVCDDMATCYPGVQNNSGKLVLVDGEDGWFLRMDGVTHYGCDPVYERICTEPKEPLCFFNMEGHPGATLLIWGAHAGFQRQAVLQPACHRAALGCSEHRQGAGRSRRTLFRRSYAPPPAITRTTASWVCCISFRRHWLGCGV